MDNAAAVDAINSGLPKDVHLSFLVRELAKLSVTRNFSYAAVHLPGVLNKASDALSRFNLELFFKLMPHARRNETLVSIDEVQRLLSHS